MRFAIRRSGVGMVLSMFFALTAPQAAKAYQVDCAILLCLAGGWPASAECAHARAVFIRRITPWPIEPPLQIWRCPMGIADRKPMQSAAPESWEAHDQKVPAFAQVILAQVVDGGADIDISGLEFDFVRSIRVWDVRYYWQRTTPAAAPQWVLPSRRCSSSNWRRGVGVEWEDHVGNHGYEWVAY